MTNNASGLHRLAHYLGVAKPQLAFLLPLTFIIAGGSLAYFLPHVDHYVPGGAPVTQIFLELVWFALMVYGLLGHRKSYREKYGERAYLKMVEHYFLPAGILMLNGVLRPIWVMGGTVPFFGDRPLLRFVVGFYLVSVGILLEVKGVKSLGIDRVVFVYTVFPERGRQIQSALYQFLRHPLYSAMSHIALGIACLAGTAAGLGCALIFAGKLWLWSKLEEKELVERFGESYAKYRNEVPAFIPKLKQLKTFWKELL